MKPSEFCKSILHYRKVKTYDFVKTYFSDPAVLIAAIKRYTEVSRIQNGESTLTDLLRT